MKGINKLANFRADMSSLLKEAREKQGLTTEDISKVLNIRSKYLKALEENKLEYILADVYAEGYRQLYARYLGVKLNEKSLTSPHFKESTHEENVRHSNFLICPYKKPALILISIIFLLIL